MKKRLIAILMIMSIVISTSIVLVSAVDNEEPYSPHSISVNR